MKFNKIYKRTALPMITFANQLEKDLKEICEDFSDELSFESYVDRQIIGDQEFPLRDGERDSPLWRIKIYLDPAKLYYVTLESPVVPNNLWQRLVKISFTTPRETLDISSSGGGEGQSHFHRSYCIFKSKYGFGLSLFKGGPSEDQPCSTYNISTYFFKMKNLEDNKEYFCCYSNSGTQTPAGTRNTTVAQGYLLKSFQEGIESFSPMNFSHIGGNLSKSLSYTNISQYGVTNVFTNIYSLKDGSYAEHCYMKLCTEEDLLGHFIMGGKEFISGSWLALEC